MRQESTGENRARITALECIYLETNNNIKELISTLQVCKAGMDGKSVEVAKLRSLMSELFSGQCGYR